MSDILARLIASGTPADLVGEVAMLIARAEVDRQAIDARRGAEAEKTRRYRQRGGGQVDSVVRRQILDRDGHACVECDSTEALEIDHIIPLMKGGDPVHPDNLQTLCRSCNARKRDRFRKADNRGKLRTDAVSADVADETPAPSPSSSPDPSNNPTPTPVETPRARKGLAPAGHRLPESWQPEPLTGPIGEATAQWPPGALDRELARFRDWAASATGPNAKKSDWQAAFRNWLRKADDEGRYRGRKADSMGRNRSDGQSGHGRTIDAALAFIADGQPH